MIETNRIEHKERLTDHLEKEVVAFLNYLGGGMIYLGIAKDGMRIFRDMELVEQLGSAVPRILRAYAKECFQFSTNFIRMSFPINPSIEPVGVNEGLNVGVNVGVNVGLNELLEIIRNSPGINAKKIAQYFDVADRTLERWLKQLRDEDKIIFKGAPKTGGYFIKEKQIRE
ncbi:hypothetical protein [Sphingobacterium pedocola]|uniref:Schlafen AlbA-2 domain-containing protein n=1 Tax=Sphingobacterium pedocola TaxID=2082722 RepID=A0ABR9T9P8_9SPHI|nr:hypothetical protein [Sphingobacterium pedocola]MBE8722038.1 hypothetical protein [Sphingobacterium pedocola]